MGLRPCWFLLWLSLPHCLILLKSSSLATSSNCIGSLTLIFSIRLQGLNLTSQGWWFQTDTFRSTHPLCGLEQVHAKGNGCCQEQLGSLPLSSQHSQLPNFLSNFCIRYTVSSPSLTDSVPISDLRLSQGSHADEEPDPFLFLRTAIASVQLTQQAEANGLHRLQWSWRPWPTKHYASGSWVARILSFGQHLLGTMGQNGHFPPRTDWLALNNIGSTAKSNCASFRTEQDKIDTTIPIPVKVEVTCSWYITIYWVPNERSSCHCRSGKYPWTSSCHGEKNLSRGPAITTVSWTAW